MRSLPALRFCCLARLGIALSLAGLLVTVCGCQPPEIEPAARNRTRIRPTLEPPALASVSELDETIIPPPAALPPLTVDHSGPTGPDTVVVCRQDWRSALTAWWNYRQSQGHRLQWLEIPNSPQGLKQHLQQLHQQGLKYVLLVGDIPEVGNAVYDGEGIPTGVLQSEISHRFGGPDIVASDNWLVDFDGDHAPELAIGRWAVDSEEELEGVVTKTIDFEQKPDPEFLRRQIEFVAGVGGFGYLQDKVIETTASRLLTDLLPGDHQVRMTHASWRSVYCPGPDCYEDKFFESLNSGALFWVYMGHGSHRGLDTATFPDQRVVTLNTRKTDRLQSQFPSIALLLACSTGEFANAQDCLAERMVATPRGPVAAIGGSGVTAPFGLASFGFELLSHYRFHKPEILGDWIVDAKRSLLLEDSVEAATENEEQGSRMPWQLSHADYRMLLRQLAKVLSPTSDILQQELEEHAEMMTLFGDPLLRLPRFETIDLKMQRPQEDELQITGSIAHPGVTSVEIELVHPLDRLSFRPDPRPTYRDDSEFHQTFVDTYSRANDRLIGRYTAIVREGKFDLHLSDLEQLPKHFWIRALANQPNCRALGYCQALTAGNWQEEFPKQDAETSDSEQESKNPFAGVLEQDQEFQAEGDPIRLFDNRSLDGWTKTNFGGEQEVLVTDQGELEIETGYPMTGITFGGTQAMPVKELPKENYELQLRVQKVDGVDFFTGLTFPVGEQPCSFIVGGWGGTTVGLSSIDGQDAARNATRSVHKFEKGKWYLIRVRVTQQRIQCWIDRQQVVDQPREGHEFSVRSEVRLSMPLGFCNFQTTSRISDFQLVRLKPRTDKPAPETRDK